MAHMTKSRLDSGFGKNKNSQTLNPEPYKIKIECAIKDNLSTCSADARVRCPVSILCSGGTPPKVFPLRWAQGWNVRSEFRRGFAKTAGVTGTVLTVLSRASHGHKGIPSWLGIGKAHLSSPSAGARVRKDGGGDGNHKALKLFQVFPLRSKSGRLNAGTSAGTGVRKDGGGDRNRADQARRHLQGRRGPPQTPTPHPKPYMGSLFRRKRTP